MVGIYGMGGLGKTTLADAVFKQLRSNFDNHCFLRNFREQLEKHGSNYVEDKFFKTLSGEENMVLVDSVKERLRHKKLLIVLDDVDKLEECHSLLIKDHDAWLNSESKVIITSRDQQVLRNIIGDDAWLYSLQTLNREEALELFYLHAFKGKAVDQNYKELSEKFVDYAKGLPLALKVLGSQLFGKDKNVWQSMLSKLKVHPDQGIVKVLRISFDGLEELEKSIFLDIACFFRGCYCGQRVKHMLDACYGSSWEAGIEVLVDKCLITKYYFGEKSFILLEMHDLLQEMGQSIACVSDDRCLENYSRLWRPEDIRHVLKNNIGTSVFKKMSSLKLLKLSTDSYDGNNPFQLPHGLDSFLIELRVLEWGRCPLESLGSKLTLRNLVYLGMPWSQLEKLWDGFQDLENLKYVDLSDSKKLICLPDLSRANLCHMDLQGCESLVELPPLRFNNVHDGKLELRRCCNLRIVSEMFGNIKSIDLSYTAIEELHSSIGSLKNLHELNLSYCEYLKKLPSSICNSESLQLLNMSGCVSIDKFPELPKNIKKLDLRETSIQQINSLSFECMPFLESLDMRGCTMLESLPTTICKLKSLKVLSFGNCSKLKKIPEIKEPMEKLWDGFQDLCHMDLEDCESLVELPPLRFHNVHDGMLFLTGCCNLRIVSEMFGNIKLIDLSYTAIEELHSSIGSLKNLHELDLSHCEHLKKLPSSICYSESLQVLNMRRCVSIDKFPELPKNIKELDLSETSIQQINSSSFECMPFLEKLYFSHCSQLKSFPEISEPMENLRKLYLNGTWIDEVPQSICKLKSLEELSLGKCSQLKSFPEILEPMENLKELYLDGTLIDEFPPIEYLPKLTILDLGGCKNLKYIPMSNIYNMPNISSVYLEEYQKDQDWAVLSDVWISETLQQSKCRCSCSNTNLISILKMYAICDYYKFWKDFTCCECVLFYTIHNILVTTAQQDKIIKPYNRFVAKALYGPRVIFCYLGYKIPQWFAYKSKGFALPVDSAPSTWNGDKSFLGIVICLVVDLGNFNFGLRYFNDLTILCEINCVISMHQPLLFRSHLEITQIHTQYDTDRVFILYLTRRDISDAKELKTFKFNIRDRVDITYSIKECGIHFIYKEDAKEFGTIHPETRNAKRTKI